MEFEHYLTNFVTNLDKKVFGLKNLPEEVISLLFAYYSRSEKGLREVLQELLKEELIHGEKVVQTPILNERAKKFHEKWVIGYGHSSIAEHSMLHIGVEDFSILAVKELEKARLASFTEKSTRFVLFSPEKIYEPPIKEQELKRKYVDYTRKLITTYVKWYELYSKPLGEIKVNYAISKNLRHVACDLLRYLLPCSVLTNVGITVNARELAYIIRRLLASKLPEVKELGGLLLEEGKKLTPTLLRYIEPSPSYTFINERIEANFRKEDGYDGITDELVNIINIRGDIDDIILAILFETSPKSFVELQFKVKNMKEEEKLVVLKEYVLSRGEHEQGGRALEAMEVIFEVTCDYGSLRDIQRHRITTLIEQPLTPYLGYVIPSPLETNNPIKGEYINLMVEGIKLYEEIKEKEGPFLAQYSLPLAFRKKALFIMNLREIIHFLELRSRPQGHPSYRTITLSLYELLVKYKPWLKSILKIHNEPLPWQDIVCKI